MRDFFVAMGPGIANHLWQSTAFVVAAWLMTLALRGNRARVRHAVWMAASVKFLAPFALLIAAGNLLPHPKQPVAPAVYSAMDVVEEPFAEIAPPTLSPAGDKSGAPEGWGTQMEAALPVALAVVWGVGAGVVLVVFAVQWRKARRTLRNAERVSGGREWEILTRSEVQGSRFEGEARATTEILELRSRMTANTHPTYRKVELRLSRERMEPGIFGVGRPVLVWPRELSARLDDAHIEAVMAHELMHVRRRDNLTAALHMLVEALFWFHPAVWWMERRMVKEREQACDEAVVEMGGDADVYAESLLKTCRFCIESPLVCVAGVTGGELKQRVMAIVTGRALLQMTWAKKLMLAAAAVCVVAAPVVFGVVRKIPLYGQILHADGQLPSFEVATIRPEPPMQSMGPPPSVGPNGEPIVSQQEFRSGPARGAQAQTSDRVRVSFVTAEQLIGLAYSIPVRPQPTYEVPVRATEIVGGPDWVLKDRYQIEAKIDDSTYAAMQKMDTAQQRKQIALMEQSLLAERFRLKVHFETREMPAYALAAAKGVAKLNPSKDEAKPPDNSSAAVKASPVPRPGFVVVGKALGFEMKATALSMHDLVPFLQQQPEMGGRVVVDQTGLGGTYDFKMDWTREDSPGATDAPSSPGNGPHLFAALKEQLGLELVETKEPVEILVIDHIERPTVDGAEVASPTLSPSGDRGGAPMAGGVVLQVGRGISEQVVSDTGGVDFSAYVRQVQDDVARNEARLKSSGAAAAKSGSVTIRLSILPDGKIAAMKLEQSSGDKDLDKVAWYSVTSEGSFPPLPSAFHGPQVELQLKFAYNEAVAEPSARVVPLAMVQEKTQGADAAARPVGPARRFGFPIIPQPGAPLQPAGMGTGTDGSFELRVDSKVDKPIKFFRLGWAFVMPSGFEYHVGEDIVPYNEMPPHATYGFSGTLAEEPAGAMSAVYFIEQVMLDDGTDWRADHKQIEADYAKRMARVQAAMVQEKTQAPGGLLAAYDVVSVRPTNASPRFVGLQEIPDGLTSETVTLAMMVQWAYSSAGVPTDDAVAKLPDWAKMPYYFSVQAKLSAEQVAAFAKLDKDQQKACRTQMLRALLADRFKLQVHYETKQVPSYDLVVASGGIKMKELAASDPGVFIGSNGKPLQRDNAAWIEHGSEEVVRDFTVDQLAAMLASSVDHRVVDKTGLTGIYSYTLRYAVSHGVGPAGGPTETVASDPAPTVFQAVEEQLGLRLQKGIATVDTVVVDHVERPAAN